MIWHWNFRLGHPKSEIWDPRKPILILGHFTEPSQTQKSDPKSSKIGFVTFCHFWGSLRKYIASRTNRFWGTPIKTGGKIEEFRFLVPLMVLELVLGRGFGGQGVSKSGFWDFWDFETINQDLPGIWDSSRAHIPWVGEKWEIRNISPGAITDPWESRPLKVMEIVKIGFWASLKIRNRLKWDGSYPGWFQKMHFPCIETTPGGLIGWRIRNSWKSMVNLWFLSPSGLLPNRNSHEQVFETLKHHKMTKSEVVSLNEVWVLGLLLFGVWGLKHIT